MSATPSDRFAELCAPAHWQAVDFISDLHLQASEPGTHGVWCDYLRQLANGPVDALFILGDLFEVWVGDDVLSASQTGATPEDTTAALEHRFLRACATILRETAQHKPVYFMRGNRDFLLGPQALKTCGMQELDDPTVLVFQQARWLLSHGDALCLEDHDYMRFRSQVRQPDWQSAFLARPLAEREALARDMRAQSQARQLTVPFAQTDSPLWADLDGAATRQWLNQAGAHTLIHGHTHRPGAHDLGDGLQRVVLSDWDATAQPPRAEVLRLDGGGLHRMALSLAGQAPAGA